MNKLDRDKLDREQALALELYEALYGDFARALKEITGAIRVRRGAVSGLDLAEIENIVRELKKHQARLDVLTTESSSL